MGAMDEVIHFLTSGHFAGLPTVVIMIIPFVIGLILGYLIRKMLKWAIIAAVILIVVSYLGFFGLSLGALKNAADTWGPIVYQYGVLLVGMLPLGLGFIVGLIIGFII
jgi:hypothetical protein